MFSNGVFTITREKEKERGRLGNSGAAVREAVRIPSADISYFRKVFTTKRVAVTLAAMVIRTRINYPKKIGKIEVNGRHHTLAK